MRTKILAGVAVLGVVWAVSCSTSSDGPNNGGNAGDSGGSGGDGDGGKGGKGGTASGGNKGGSGAGGSVPGGSGGGSGGAVGGSGGSVGGAGTGGTTFAAKHPTWDFEEEADALGWTNGVDHIGTQGQCDHGRYASSQPVVSTEQKKDGTKSLMFEIDVASAKAAYDALKCMECTAATGGDAGSDAMTCKPKAGGGIALIATSGPLSSWIQKKVLGKGPVILPAGTVVKFNVWFPGSKAPGVSVSAYMLGVGAEWTQGGPVVFQADQWSAVMLDLPTARPVSSDWSELGILINGLPPNFKGKVYIDAVDIELP